ncbi:Transposon Ty3-I Gag-Pol poly, partial [Brachionus plicatilis]
MTVEDLTKTNDLLKHTGFILDKEVEVVFDTGASSSIIGLNTAKKLGLNILASDKSINTADGSTNKVIGVTEEIELKVEETVANLSLIITNVSHIEVLLGLDWFDQTKVVLDPARRILKIPGKNIKLDSEEESDVETEINAYLADQEPDDIFSDEIIDCEAKFELKQTNLKVLNGFLKQNEDVFAKSLNDLKE